MRNKWLAAPFVAWSGLIGLVVAACILKGVHVGWLTREMATTARVHPFMGVISNIGAFAWTATGAICLFSGVLLWRRKSPASGFLLSTAAFSLWLLFDDFFMFHDYLAGRYLHLGEHFIYAAYALVGAGYLFLYRRRILRSDYRLLVVAFAGFALSLGFDIVEPIHSHWNLLPEDGFKLLGILCWLAYHAGAAYEELDHSMGAAK